MSAPSRNAILAACLDHLHERVDRLKQELVSLQEVNEREVKSSAGDKHETARAMAQLEREKLGQQLQIEQRMLHELEQLKPEQAKNQVTSGSIVETHRGTFFISVALGRVDFGEQMVYAMSPHTPLARLLMGKVPGNEITYNGITYRIDGLK